MNAIEIKGKEEQLTEIYEYDGLYFKVTETEAIHKKLQSDGDFAASYFGSKKAILSLNDNEHEDVKIEESKCPQTGGDFAVSYLGSEESISTVNGNEYSNEVLNEEHCSANDPSQPCGDFAVSYFGSEETIPTINGNEYSNEVQCSANDPSQPDETTFRWDHETIQLLLDEYLKLKEHFYNPKIRKSLLWTRIRETFLEHGYDISLDFISTKYRNLKKTFLKIYYNNKTQKKGTERITWVYYDIFLEILKDDGSLKINRPSNLVQNQPGSSFRRIAPAPAGSSAVTLVLAASAATTKSTVMAKKTPFSLRKAAKRRATLLKKKIKARTKYLETEEKRAREIQNLVYVIKENNRIQEERNRLLKELINKCKCNEAAKLFM